MLNNFLAFTVCKKPKFPKPDRNPIETQMCEGFNKLIITYSGVHVGLPQYPQICKVYVLHLTITLYNAAMFVHSTQYLTKCVCVVHNI